MELLAKRPVVKARGVTVPDVEPLKRWIGSAATLSESALADEVAKNGHPLLVRTLEWTREVNAAVKKISRNCPPFKHVRETLNIASSKADILVVSQTPTEALEREWEEHGIQGYPAVIAGQEMGSKKEHLQWATRGKYARNMALMVGDAPGDQAAALANDCLFFPINPGHEEESWECLKSEGLERFFGGSFEGPYQEKLLSRFFAYLPEVPPWKE